MKTLKNLFYFPLVALILVGCETDELPILSTSEITEITSSSAICGGSVTSDGGVTVTARGVCWNTTGNPTIADNKTIDSTGVGSFTSEIEELSPNTSYYVRAYATNAVGTAYGEEVSFKTELQIIEINNVKIVNTGSGEQLDFLDYYSPGWDPYNPEKKQFSLNCDVDLDDITQIKDYLNDIKEITIDSIQFTFITNGGADDMDYIIYDPWSGFTQFEIDDSDSWGSGTETYLNKSFTQQELKDLSKEFLDKKNLFFFFLVNASHLGPTHSYHTCSMSVTMFANFKAEVEN